MVSTWSVDYIELFFRFFSVRFLSVLRGHSVVLSPPQGPMPSDFEGFSYQILSITFFYPILILFPFFNVECQTSELLVPFLYVVFGMTRSLTGD